MEFREKISSMFRAAGELLGPGKLSTPVISREEYISRIVEALGNELSNPEPTLQKHSGTVGIMHQGRRYEADLSNDLRYGDPSIVQSIGKALEIKLEKKPEIALVPDEGANAQGNIFKMHVEITMPEAEVAAIRNVKYPPEVEVQRPSVPFSVLAQSDQMPNGFSGPSSLVDPRNAVFGPGGNGFSG